MTWKFRTEKNLTYEIKCSEITGELQENSGLSNSRI